MATALITASVYCKFCRKWKTPSHINRQSERQGSFCHDCYYKFLVWELVEFAKGEPPPGCPECGRSKEELAMAAEREGALDGDNVSMFMHVKDGIMQLLCKPCSDRYSATSGMFKGTQFEHDAKLKGYK